VARPGTPFRVVEALAARGAPDAALAVQRCRGAPPAGLPQAQVLLDVRLAEGLLTDAVTQVGRAQPLLAHTAAAAAHLVDPGVCSARFSPGCRSTSIYALSAVRLSASILHGSPRHSLLVDSSAQMLSKGGSSYRSSSPGRLLRHMPMLCPRRSTCFAGAAFSGVASLRGGQQGGSR
jgi:hypothetical protein